MEAELQIKDEGIVTKIMPVIVGESLFKIGSWEFVWWGFSQIHKWRWFKDHIDLGALSVYGFSDNHWFWRIISVLIKPLRWNYHKRFVAPEY